MRTSEALHRQEESRVAPVGVGAAVLLGLSLLLTATLGILSLWTPFLVDQSIFAYGGRTIASGETLYVDYWDIKPPGIFYLFALAGVFFGLDEPGIHTAELLWQLAAGMVLAWIAMLCVRHPVAVALVPLASVGTYYAFATSEHMTQVEALMSLPMALALLSSFKLSQRVGSFLWSFLFGASASVIALLKLPYVLMPLIFVAFVLVRLWRDESLEWKTTWRMAITALAGFLVVWAPIVLHLTMGGAFREFFSVTFLYPRSALHESPAAPYSRLTDSFLWTLHVHWPFLPLVLLGLLHLRRTRQPFLALGALFYLGFGTLLIVLQRISWWEYHQVLLFAPLGLLAAFGLDWILTVSGSESRKMLLASVLGVLLLGFPTVLLCQRGLAKFQTLQSAARMDFEAPLAVRTDRDSRRVWSKSQFLRDPGSSPGPIYVFGDQRYLWMSGRRQAIAVRGHAWALLPESKWQTVPEELMAANPTYLFLSRYNRRVLKDRAPQLLSFIRTRYRRTLATRNGWWWVNKAVEGQ